MIAQTARAGILPCTGNNELENGLPSVVFVVKALESLASGGSGCEEFTQVQRELY